MAARGISVAGLVLMALSIVAADALAASDPRFSAPVFVVDDLVVGGLVADDFNRDGNQDLAVADYDSGSRSRILVFRGAGDGGFRKRVAYRIGRSPVDMATADFNGDGWLDIVTVSDHAGGFVTVLLNDGTGRFGRKDRFRSGPPSELDGVAVADVNRDGLVDLTIRGFDYLVVRLNDGAGNFRLTERFAPVGPFDLGDVNADGKLDLFTMEDFKEFAIRLGNGDGTFGAAQRYVTSDSDIMSVTVADLNHDGRSDLAIANEFNLVSVFLADADGTLAAPGRYRLGMSAGGPHDVVLADFNGDTHLDMIATSGNTYPPRILRARGDGTFRKSRRFHGGAHTGNSAVADFNNDGRLDIALEELGMYTVEAYLNWTGLRAAPCAVPDVRRSPLRVARRNLRRSGCRPGRVRFRFSEKVRRGGVISQRPARGAVLPSHGRVRLRVSHGPSR
jgi:VCBS repeat protein/PASTA domain-containing protein